MCCGRVGGVVGVVGALLILLGLTQIAAGVYFMLLLPIFQLGSNIWTGAWSGVCGAVLGIIGWRKQTMRRGSTVLMTTLSVLMVNVGNLVILQVGENGVFLSEDDVRIIVENNQDTALLIAFWLTTVVTAVAIVVSFCGAQYLFCVVVRGPKVKGRLPVTRTLSEEGLHHRQESHDSTPSLEDVVALPDPGGSSAWVYHPEDDKSPTLLQSMGLDLLTDLPIGSRRLPGRHASFATSRYARVYQRPQRAQSFAVRQDLQVSNSLPRKPPPVLCPEPTSSRLSSHYARPNARRIHRSNSVSGRMLLEESKEGATLSHKFHACSLDEVDGAPVIKVGMLSRERSRSEQSLHSTCQEPSTDGTGSVHIQRTASVQERLLDGKTVLTSFGPVSRPAAHTIKPKGPAPPPPTKIKPVPASTAQSALSTKQNDEKEMCDAETAATIRPTEEEDQRTENIIKNHYDGQTESPRSQEGIEPETRLVASNTRRVLTLERHLPLPVIEENIRNARKRPAPQPRSILPSQSDDESSRDASAASQSGRLKPARPGVVKPPRSSLTEKPPRLVDKNTAIRRPCPVKKPERKQPENVTVDSLRRLEEALTNILDYGDRAPLRATKSDENIKESLTLDTKVPKSILKKSLTKPSKYEVAHREALEDSRALLDQLPRSELQRNKIVLRVPSFRTAGCQTEGYRPVRRRASCAQTNLSVAPRYKETTTTTNTSTITSSRAPPTQLWTPPERRANTEEAAVIESSSSGYSSPEVGSKDPTPAHSGPPSPASSSAVASDEEERRHDTNVTVIEVNKSEAAPLRSPLRQGSGPVPPPRPPKPLRLRCLSDAAAITSSRGGLLVPVHRRAPQLPLYEDVFGVTALAENIMLLTEAINPVLVHSTRTSEGGDITLSTMPRVVDVTRKTMDPSLQEDRPLDVPTTHVPRPRPAIRAHSLSLPRPSATPTLRPRHTRGSRSPSPRRHQQEDEGSTAAYLASLELLASLYRHQAIANAKQLQLQQRLLLQQQLKQQQSQLADERADVRQPPPPSTLVSPVKDESDC